MSRNEETAMPPPPVLMERYDPNDAIKLLVIQAIGLTLAVQLTGSLEEHFAPELQDPTFVNKSIGSLLSIYFAISFVFRFVNEGSHVLYDAMWVCNAAIVLVIHGLFTGRPFFAGLAMASVSGYQLFFIFDLITYWSSGRTNFGTLQHIFESENKSTLKWVFASHHVWFLPLCFYVTMGHGGMHESSFSASFLLIFYLIAYSRLTSPFEVKLEGEDRPLYVNANCAYEFYEAKSIPFLHALDHWHPGIYIPYVTIVGNIFINGVPHMLVLGIALTLRFHPLIVGFDQDKSE